MSNPIRFIVRFTIIMLLQIVLLNDIVIRSSVTIMGIPAFIPMLYPLVLLLLPVNTPSWLAMLLGFATGLTMDYFSNTPGMHAAACVLLTYIRPFLLGLFFQQSAKELGGITPGLFRMGFSSFLVYIVVSVLVHHLLFYILQIWSWNNFGLILLKTFLSGILTILLILLSQLLFASRDIRRS